MHKIKDVEASSNETNSECKTLAYIGLILTILSLTIVTFLHYRKSRFCKGYKFSNVVKFMMFISDVQNYVPIKLCKTAGSIHLFRMRATLKPENIKLNKNYLWDTMEIDWKEVIVTFNNNKINLPRIVVIKLHDKIKNKTINEQRTITFSLDDKAGHNMVHFSNRNTRNSVDIKMYFQYFSEWSAYSNPNATSCIVILDAIYQLKQWT